VGQSSGQAFIEHEVSRMNITLGAPLGEEKKLSSLPLLGLSRVSRREVDCTQQAPLSMTWAEPGKAMQPTISARPRR